MKQKYYTFLIISTLLLSNLATAQDDKSDAIFLKLEKEYQLNEDGSMDFRLQKQLKLLTYYSFHRIYGETFIVYNPLYQNLKINKSYTIMADGKKVQTPDNAFNELLPRFATDAPDHNYLREMAITHTGLEKNAVINLDYSIHTKKDFLPVFRVSEYIGEQSPINELVIKIKIPLNKTARFQLLNSDVKPKISEENNMRTYTWVFNNLPAYLSNVMKADWETYAPMLLFSTANNREEYVAAILNQAAFEYQINDKMIKKVESLRTDSSDDLDLALKIQKYVVDEFKIKYISSKYTGYQYRQANEVWESAYGTKAEKLILLTAFLKAANLDAVPYAVIPAVLDYDDICVPVIRDFIVRVKTKDGSRFFLSTDRINKQDAAYSLSDMTIVPLSYQENPEILNGRKENNEIDFEGDIILKKDGHAKALINAQMTYALNPFFDLKRNKTAAKKFIRGDITSSNCKVKIIESTAEKSIIEYSLENKESLDKKANYMFFELPYLSSGIEDLHINELATERSVPLKIPTALNESYKYEIELDEGLSLVNPEIKIEEKNNVGKIFIEIKDSGNKVKINRSISIFRHQVSTDDYPAFRKLMNLWNDVNYREIVVREE